MKQSAIMVGLVLAGMAAVLFGQPLMAAYSAERQFNAASYYSFGEKCEIATRAKDAWAGTMFTSKSSEWANTADSYCGIARR